MKILCIIPAKGASTRLPKKNIIDFYGKPLLDYTIEAAIKADIFTDIVVSTEDEEVANVAKKFQEVDLLIRPKKLAVDPATIMDVCNWVLDKKGIEYEYVFIMLSSALRTSEHVKAVLELLKEKNANSVISVTKYSFPLMYAFLQQENGELKEAFPDKTHLKTQNFPEYLVGNGGIYGLKQEFIRQKKYTPDKTFPYLMPFWASVDIDTYEDLDIAKAMYKYFYLNEKSK